MNITELTVHELKEKLANKEITISEITKAYADRINEKEPEVGAFVTTYCEKWYERNIQLLDETNNKRISKRIWL